jgi:hypothetical protein
MSHQSDVQKLLTDMATAASATATAAIFTNPAEVIKTRLQLQGEMKASIADGAPRYTGVGDAVVKIARHEGIAALQKGLGAGMIYQVFMNGTRLGCYPSLKRLFNYDSSESIANFAKGLTAGAISGGMGAIVGSPFYMVKCRLQAQSTVIGVDGFQHHYKGMVDGLAKVPHLQTHTQHTHNIHTHTTYTHTQTHIRRKFLFFFSCSTGVEGRGAERVVSRRRRRGASVITKAISDDYMCDH